MSLQPTTAAPTQFDIVVPTVGRPSLSSLLKALTEGAGPRPSRIVLVDDRRRRAEPLLANMPCPLPAPLVYVVTSSGRGPAAARNTGWRAASSPWVAFLDDDVVPDADWLERLHVDLQGCGPQVAASQGRLTVPLPDDGRPRTEWERDIAALAGARWITADMAYRRAVLEALGGFDERFSRPYREGAELALRTVEAGYQIVSGSRHVAHPVPPAPWHASLSKQTANADDALMNRLHGRAWRARSGGPGGTRGRDLAVTAVGLLGLVGAATGRRPAAVLGLGAWLAGTAGLAWRRIQPGPRTRREVATIVATSLALPATATAWWLGGVVRTRHMAPKPRTAPAPGRPIDAVLFDRDGALMCHIPYTGGPNTVVEMPGAGAALDRLRQAGLPTAVVTNQSGVARGVIDADQVDAVNARVATILGPFDAWFVCPHDEGDNCECRMPNPGMVLKAAAELGVAPEQCALIGDTGADLEAAQAAGAVPILIPTGHTQAAEIASAPAVVSNLHQAVDLVLSSREAPR